MPVAFREAAAMASDYISVDDLTITDVVDTDSADSRRLSSSATATVNSVPGTDSQFGVKPVLRGADGGRRNLLFGYETTALETPTKRRFGGPEDRLRMDFTQRHIVIDSIHNPLPPDYPTHLWTSRTKLLW